MANRLRDGYNEHFVTFTRCNNGPGCVVGKVGACARPSLCQEAPVVGHIGPSACNEDALHLIVAVHTKANNDIDIFLLRLWHLCTQRTIVLWLLAWCAVCAYLEGEGQAGDRETAVG